MTPADDLPTSSADLYKNLIPIFLFQSDRMQQCASFKIKEAIFLQILLTSEVLWCNTFILLRILWGQLQEISHWLLIQRCKVHVWIIPYDRSLRLPLRKCKGTLKVTITQYFKLKITVTFELNYILLWQPGLNREIQNDTKS